MLLNWEARASFCIELGLLGQLWGMGLGQMDMGLVHRLDLDLAHYEEDHFVAVPFELHQQWVKEV